jgi:hypothetical protein
LEAAVEVLYQVLLSSHGKVEGPNLEVAAAEIEKMGLLMESYGCSLFDVVLVEVLEGANIPV